MCILQMFLPFCGLYLEWILIWVALTASNAAIMSVTSEVHSGVCTTAEL